MALTGASINQGYMMSGHNKKPEKFICKECGLEILKWQPGIHRATKNFSGVNSIVESFHSECFVNRTKKETQ